MIPARSALIGAAMLSFLQAAPLVRGRVVTFLADGDSSDPPRIVGDFNGWEGGAMTPSGDGRSYTLRVSLDPAARIEYLIAYSHRFVVDPHNPLTVPAPTGAPRSELRMPEYRAPATLPMPRARGRVEDVPFTSQQGERRRIRVYVPDQMRDGLPVLYVHDGDIVLDKLETAPTLDALIGAGRMPPMVVAFIDSLDRHGDYIAGSPFRSVVTREILPLIEARYHASRERRAMMGVSQSTVGALDTCVNGGVVFESCVLIAPAVELREFDRLLPAAGSRIRFLIEAGSYDVPLVTNARALRDQLVARRLLVRYFESPQGHNHTAFRAHLPELLAETF